MQWDDAIDAIIADRFTFHYGEIDARMPLLYQSEFRLFTFHYGEIDATN